jgi:predicted phosphohydrolase
VPIKIVNTNATFYLHLIKRERERENAHTQMRRMSVCLQIVSDLHLELRGGTIPKPPPVLVPKIALLGDISMSRLSSYRMFLEMMSQHYEDMFVIVGNHEYYNSHCMHISITDEITDVCMAYPNIHFLDNESVDINGIKYIGTTLWSHVSKEHEPVVTCGINDYMCIQCCVYDPEGTGRMRTPVTVGYTNILHEAAMHFIKQELEKESEMPTIILLHHTPSFKSIHPDFQGSPYNSAYVTNLEELMKLPVIAWFHSHTHHAMKYKVNNILMVSNPMGYLGEKNTGYDPNFVFEFNL